MQRTKRETWLRPNRRPHLLIAIPGLVFLVGGAVAMWFVTGRWGQGLGGLVAVLGLLFFFTAWSSSLQPRLSYGDEQLFVYLRAGKPISIPIEVVECFFLGQASSLLGPASVEVDEPTSTIVIRLAESAAAWKQFDVNARLGRWCDGYVTIRGTWCEPINVDLLKNLNHRLAVVHRMQRGRQDATDDAVVSER